MIKNNNKLYYSELGIKGKITAKTILIFYSIIKPIRYLNYKIFVYLINNHFNSFKKKIISNNTIKSISNFWIIYIFVKFFLLINRGDRFKHWDTLKEIVVINNYVNKSDKLLFCSTGKYIGNLLYFKSLGYKKIEAFDILSPGLIIKSILKRKGIVWSQKDLYNLKLDRKVNFISLLSVIEHLNNPDLLFQNLSNNAEQNCKLLVTTDFWPEKITTSGKFPYGKDQPEMKIFSKDEIISLIEIANKYGFELVDKNIDFSVIKKLVKWERMNESYTFISLLFNLTKKYN